MAKPRIPARCVLCHGTGRQQSPCGACGGMGRRRQMNTETVFRNGKHVTQTRPEFVKCLACGGMGRLSSVCAACGGTGVIR
jgi:RecJ-like exonuclease